MSTMIVITELVSITEPLTSPIICQSFWVPKASIILFDNPALRKLLGPKSAVGAIAL